jgi:hypothetical protein
MEQPDLPIRLLALRVCDKFSESDFAKYLRIRRQRRVPHIEFHSRNIFEITPWAIVQLKDNIPVLWAWILLKGTEQIGWKSHFVLTDSRVTQITHVNLPLHHVIIRSSILITMPNA